MSPPATGSAKPSTSSRWPSDQPVISVTAPCHAHRSGNATAPSAASPPALRATGQCRRPATWPPALGERFGDFRFLIRDRGPNFTASVDAVFQATGTTIVRTAVQAPRMNAICERLISTLRRELLDRTLILNQAHLRAVLAEYQEHYNTARPHQGTGQHIPHSGPAPRVTAADPGACQIRRKPVLSGLINEYERAA